MAQAHTELGWVEGEQRGAHVAFRGIPFAKPPIGPLRFRAPEPAEPWAGLRSARDFGPSPIQLRGGLVTSPVPEPISEDCLYLNVYTPAVDDARRPVFFWIHGGAFGFGAGGEPVYDGGRLAERGDVVVITINYRVGALGFSHWSETEREQLAVTCNAGVLDQIAALRWVQANIAAFGGDPGSVTIAGESAGAFSVAMLLAMPAARGLFHRAIAQSGARLTRGGGDPGRATRELVQALELSDQPLKALWDVPAERILAAQQQASVRSGRVSAFSPSTDGDTLPLPLEEALAGDGCAKVPLLIGTNRDEMNLFLGAAIKKLNEPLDDATLIKELSHVVRGASEGQLRALLDVYRSSRSAHRLPHGDRALLAAITSDALWRVPSYRFAEAYRRHQPATFQYLFKYESPAMRGALRSCHGLELPFVFGTLDAPGQAAFAGSGEAVQRLSDRVMASWLSFTRTGDPSIAGAGQAWPPYELERRPTMVFDRESGLEYAPYEEERAAWEDLTPRAL